MNLHIGSIISVTLLVALIPYLKLSRTKGEIKPKKASFKPDMKLLFLICCVCEIVANSVLFYSVPAVYLCKRTMQNKARLELADYEAVSTWQKVTFSAGPNEPVK